MHPVITFFAASVLSNASHLSALRCYICCRLEFCMAYSAVLFIDFVETDESCTELALTSSVKLGTGVLFKTELLGRFASSEVVFS